MNTWQTLEEANTMYKRLQNEWRHRQAMGEAELEGRKRGMSFVRNDDAQRWLDVVTQIKALETARGLGWDTDKQVAELWQLADGIVAEDEVETIRMVDEDSYGGGY